MDKFLADFRKRLVAQFLDIIVLLLLRKSKSEHPSDIGRFCEAMFGVKVNPDSLYCLLLTLERRGLIKGETRQILDLRTVRFYSLTEKGNRIIRGFIKNHDEMMTFVRFMFENQEGT